MGEIYEQSQLASGVRMVLVDDDVKARLKKLFQTADGSSTGYISREEARDLIQRAGLPTINDEQFNAFFDTLDISHDNRVSFDEFRMFSVDIMKRMFMDIDIDGDGTVSETELKALLSGFGIAGKSVSQYIQAADTNADNLISFPEFVHFLLTRHEAVDLVFSMLDTDKSGTLNIAEMKAALQNLGLPVTDQQVQGFMANIDVDASGEIDFKEFNLYLLSLPKISPAAVFDHMRSQIYVDVGDEFQPPRELPKDHQLRVLMGGALAGMVGRTCVAPLFRVMVMAQANTGQSVSSISVLRDMYREGGIRGMFRGNLSNCLRVGPESALKCFLFDTFRQRIAGDPKAMTAEERMLSGTCAGICSSMVTYPLETVRTKMSVAAESEYKGTMDCLRHQIAEGGARSLYRGLPASLITIVPYAVVFQGTFSKMKELYVKLFPHESPGRLSTATAAGVASFSAQVFCYPLSVIRTRQILVEAPSKSGGMVALASSVVRTEGLRGLYKGLTVSCLKVVPSVAISFTTYEAFMQCYGGPQNSQGGSAL